MFESIIAWITLHADHAPWFVFGLLLLTGFSFPISEDLIVIASGVLASTIMPENVISLFFAVCTGVFLSDWIAYWIGRLLGNKIAHLSLFRKTLSIERRKVVESFFQRYGFLTLFIGRLIPFGIRNTIFIAAGAAKMHFGRFLLSDGFGSLVFSSTIYFLAFRCGENYDHIHVFLNSIGYVIGFGIIVSLLSWYIWVRVAREQTEVS